MKEEYDPLPYWERRGRRYVTRGTDFNTDVISLDDALSTLLDDPTILEVGSGYGRIYDHLRRSMSMCDISRSMISECLERTGFLPTWWDGVTLPYDDNSFDFLISYDVLLHVPPDDVLQHLSELLRVSSHYIYIATSRDFASGGHCFSHDYDALFHLANVRLLSSHEYGPGPFRVHYLLEGTI